MEIHNCHAHVFTNRAVPNGFLFPGMMPLLRTTTGARVIDFALRRLWPFSKTDRLEKVAGFARIGRLPGSAAIFELLQAYYPAGTKFIVLPMDMDFMGAGLAPQPYLKQLEELRTLRANPKYRDAIVPFVAADPRRPNLLEIVRRHVEEHGFGGIKIYPPLGFFPFDDALDPIYDYAQRTGLPVLTHCSRGGVYSRVPIDRQPRVHPKTGDPLPGRNAEEYAENFAHPDNYRWVLERYPRLKLCLAHYGGGSEWKRYLEEPWTGVGPTNWLTLVSSLIENYDNVYADVAYTACDAKHHPMMKVLINTPKLRERILYGSDFYMVQMDVTERQFSVGLRAYLGEADYRQIAVENPKRFLSRAAVQPPLVPAGGP